MKLSHQVFASLMSNLAKQWGSQATRMKMDNQGFISDTNQIGKLLFYINEI